MTQMLLALVPGRDCKTNVKHAMVFRKGSGSCVGTDATGHETLRVRHMADTVVARLLGPHELEGSNGKVTLKTRRSWGLLAYLAINNDRAVPRDELAALLWDRSPEEQARASLRQELSNVKAALRKAGWPGIEADKTSVRLDASKAVIDVREFEAAVQAGDAEGAARWYGGSFLQDLTIPSEPFEVWHRQEQHRLAERLIESQLLVLRTTSASTLLFASAARAILEVDDANEGAHRELMRHYAETGRSAEALRQYKRCEAALRDDLDVTPSRETAELVGEIRAGRALAPSSSQAETTSHATISGGKADGAAFSDAGRLQRFAVSALLAGTLLAGGTTAVAGVQYVGAGQRLTPQNIICTLPFLRRGADDVVTIGAIMPREREHGERLEWGMRRFQKENRNAYPFAFRISIEDSSGGLEGLPDIFSSFEREGVKAVIGPLESRKAWEAKLWGNREKVAIVSPLASASYLARTGGVEYFFRVGMSDGVRAKALVQWLKIKGLDTNPYVINELPGEPPKPGDPEIYGQSQATAVKAGLTEAEEITFVRGDEESQLMAATKVRNDGRAVVINGYTSNIVRIVRAMQERGVENPIFLMGVVHERLQQAHLPFPEKLHAVAGVNSEARNLSTSRQLREDFEKSADSSLEYDISAYYAYDAMGMILDAVEAAQRDSCGGYASPEAVAEALRRTPSKRRKVLHTGFLPDTQELFFETDGLRMVDGEKFVPVGIGG